MTQDDYSDMVILQGGRCAICRATDSANRTDTWNIDHCHATNRVRGLLCRNCNLGLGHFRDNPASLRAALDYLTTHSELPGGQSSTVAEADAVT